MSIVHLQTREAAEADLRARVAALPPEERQRLAVRFDAAIGARIAFFQSQCLECFALVRLPRRCGQSDGMMHYWTCLCASSGYLAPHALFALKYGLIAWRLAGGLQLAGEVALRRTARGTHLQRTAWQPPAEPGADALVLPGERHQFTPKHTSPGRPGLQRFGGRILISLSGRV